MDALLADSPTVPGLLTEYILKGECKAASLAQTYVTLQRAKSVVSDSQGVVDFAIGLVFLFLTCSTGKCCFLENSNIYRRIVTNPAIQKGFWG